MPFLTLPQILQSTLAALSELYLSYTFRCYPIPSTGVDFIASNGTAIGVGPFYVVTLSKKNRLEVCSNDYLLYQN